MRTLGSSRRSYQRTNSPSRTRRGAPLRVDLTGMLGIPQNWLVDRNGILQQKSRGFDDTVQDWPERMLQRLKQLP